MSMYTERISVSKKLFARRTIYSYIDLISYSLGEFRNANAWWIVNVFAQTILCALGNDVSSMSSMSLSEASLAGDVANVFLCFVFFRDNVEFIINKLTFKIFLLDSEVELVQAVDVERSAEDAVD